jgi:hypothetical protein
LTSSCTLVFHFSPINAILQTVNIYRDPDYPWEAYLQS